MDTKENIILSVIIPVYNCGKYTDLLLDVLDPQVKDRNDIQILIIDDGSKIPYKPKYEWGTLIRQENGGASAARNTGLDNAVGEYVSFIDGDDLVSERYIELLANKIKSEQFDYLYMSWKSFGGWKCEVNLRSVEDKFPSFNLCLWNRCYKRSLIGNVRLNTKKAIAEDAQFIKDVKEVGKKSFIPEMMYYYRSDTPDSLTKRFAKGELNTRRVVYNFNHITKDMTYLIDEVKKINEDAEVIIMTNRNDIPELAHYAMITQPIQMKGTELRGEPTLLFSKIDIPLKTQIVIWTEKTFMIGGIETFIYSFCMHLKDLYDITVLYDVMDPRQIKRLQPYVRVIKRNPNKKIICDTLLVNRITDKNPGNVIFNKKVQMVHSCQLMDSWHVPTDNDITVMPSKAVEKTYDELDHINHKVINNLTYVAQPKKVLRLISATRLTFEKGEQRMIDLANMLNAKGIPFVWTIFTERPLKEMPNGMLCIKPTLNVCDYIANSDYMVQLSNSEAFCYSIVEALELGTPVITTPIDVLPEIGFEDCVNGFVVPFDMKNVDVDKIYNANLHFKYKSKNEAIKNAWIDILGHTTPQHDYEYVEEIVDESDLVEVTVVRQYRDLQFGKVVKSGEKLNVTSDRARILREKGVAK